MVAGIYSIFNYTVQGVAYYSRLLGDSLISVPKGERSKAVPVGVCFLPNDGDDNSNIV